MAKVLANAFVSIIAITLFSCAPLEPIRTDGENTISKTGHSLVYSVNALQKDSAGNADSILGVLIIQVDSTDTIRKRAVHKWTMTAQYFTGNRHINDSSYISTDYVLETDSFLTTLAYNYASVHSGVLIKKKVGDFIDSITTKGDSIVIDEGGGKFFCKLPNIGFSWVQRPGWLRYNIDKREDLLAWGQTHTCYHIIATPLDSHLVTLKGGTYAHQSWVTPQAIVKTELSHSLPDSVWDAPCYYRLELMEDLDSSSVLPDPATYKQRIMQRGWH